MVMAASIIDSLSVATISGTVFEPAAVVIRSDRLGRLDPLRFQVGIAGVGRRTARISASVTIGLSPRSSVMVEMTARGPSLKFG
jgi:hypothetical protein